MSDFGEVVQLRSAGFVPEAAPTRPTKLVALRHVNYFISRLLTMCPSKSPAGYLVAASMAHAPGVRPHAGYNPVHFFSH